MNTKEMSTFHKILKEEYQRGYRDGQSEEIRNTQHSECIEELSIAESEIQEIEKTKRAQEIAELSERFLGKQVSDYAKDKEDYRATDPYAAGRSETSSIFPVDAT